MGFLKKLFGSAEVEEIPETPDVNPNLTVEQKEFETLRDDGIRAMRMGNYLQAENCFKAALERKEDDRVKAHLAELYIMATAGEKAVPVLKELTEKLPDELNLWKALAQASRQCKDWDTLEIAAQQVKKLDEDCNTGLFFDAIAQYGKKDYLNAVAFLTQILTAHPESPEVLMLRASVLMDMQQYSDAEQDIDLILTHIPDDEEALEKKGKIRWTLQDMDGALQVYTTLKEVNPFSQEALIQMGRIYTKINRLDEALKCYDEAISQWPDFALAYKERGGLRLRLHDSLGATDDLKKSLELAPEEVGNITGEFKSLESDINARYKAQNPFGF